MADDIEFGRQLSDAYESSTSSSRKRAPAIWDKRTDPNYTTTIKSQLLLSCGLCAPFSLTTAVEVRARLVSSYGWLTGNVLRGPTRFSKAVIAITRIYPRFGLVAVKANRNATPESRVERMAICWMRLETT
jgi:hypothetical protein